MSEATLQLLGRPLPATAVCANDDSPGRLRATAATTVAHSMRVTVPVRANDDAAGGGVDETSIRIELGDGGRGNVPCPTTDHRAILDRGGPLALLQFLNARTRFRFTGLYHADPPLLRNLVLYDRENPTLNVSGAVCPLEETYCSIVFAAERTFATRDAARDERLALHPARDAVISYVGVPVRRPNGVLWGTLCHFDARPRLVRPSELPVLQSAAAILAGWLDGMPPVA